MQHLYRRKFCDGHNILVLNDTTDIMYSTYDIKIDEWDSIQAISKFTLVCTEIAIFLKII